MILALKLTIVVAGGLFIIFTGFCVATLMMDAADPTWRGEQAGKGPGGLFPFFRPKPQISFRGSDGPMTHGGPDGGHGDSGPRRLK